MATQNERGGWNLTDEDVAEVLRLSGEPRTVRPQSDDELLVASLDGTSALVSPPYPDDCGLDLATAEDAIIRERQTANVPCGVAVALPPHTLGWIVARSSTWTRHGLIVLPGIIDQGWRGELRVLLYRPSRTALQEYDPVVPVGTRLAQLIVLPAFLPSLTVVSVPKDSLPPSDRGTSGFGSSG